MRPDLFRTLILALVLLSAVPLVSANEYIVRSGYDSPLPSGADARIPVSVPFSSLPLWVMIAQLVLLPPELFLGLKLWAYLGIRRVSGGNVLEQDVRSRVYDYICRNPGIHLRGLATETGMKLGTLRYHLGVLRHTHKISVTGDSSSVRFFENNGTYSTEEQHIHKHLRNETTCRILALLLERPSATRQDLADAAGITGPSVSWHMKRLEEDRIVSCRREGRTTRYDIPAPVAGYLRRQSQGSGHSPVPECLAGHA